MGHNLQPKELLVQRVSNHLLQCISFASCFYSELAPQTDPYLHNAIKSQLHTLVLGRTNCTCWSFYWSLNELELLPHDIPVSVFMEML